jgi:hypothetical protein
MYNALSKVESKPIILYNKCVMVGKSPFAIATRFLSLHNSAADGLVKVSETFQQARYLYERRRGMARRLGQIYF